MGVVQAAERRCVVPLEGEFAAEQTGVAAALATAYEKACRATYAAVAATQPGKTVKPASSGARKGASERLREVVGEAEEELARSEETASDTLVQMDASLQENIAGFEKLARMLSGSRYAALRSS